MAEVHLYFSEEMKRQMPFLEKGKLKKYQLSWTKRKIVSQVPSNLEFSCDEGENRVQGGYYADITEDARCQVTFYALGEYHHNQIIFI